MNAVNNNFFLQKTCEDFAFNLDKVLRKHRQGEVVGSKFTPAGLAVTVRIASLVELLPYLTSFFNTLYLAGEKLTLLLHSGGRMFEVYAEEKIVPCRNQSGASSKVATRGANSRKVKTRKRAEMVSRLHRIPDSFPAIAKVRECLSGEPRNHSPNCRGRVERFFNCLDRPLLPILPLSAALLLSALTLPPDSAFRPEDRPLNRRSVTPSLTSCSAIPSFWSSSELPVIEEKRWVH